MALWKRYQALDGWNKVAFWGSLASILGLVLTFLSPPSISQQTHGANSPAIANNNGSITIISTPDVSRPTTPTSPAQPMPSAPSIWTRPEVLLTLLGVLTVLTAFIIPLLVPRHTTADAPTPPTKSEGHES